MQATSDLVMQLRETFAVARVKLCLVAVDQHAALDICWPAEQGDADMTGDVFLHMVPMLEARGIRTLRQVREPT